MVNYRFVLLVDEEIWNKNPIFFFHIEILPRPNIAIVDSCYQTLCFQCQLVRENHLEIVTNLRFHICHLSVDNDDDDDGGGGGGVV